MSCLLAMNVFVHFYCKEDMLVLYSKVGLLGLWSVVKVCVLPWWVVWFVLASDFVQSRCELVYCFCFVVCL